jgi:hypothetical protein
VPSSSLGSHSTAQPSPGQFESAHPALQHVVEVVCDASGQLADRLHFLRLPQLLLRLRKARLILQPFGDVDRARVGRLLSDLPCKS